MRKQQGQMTIFIAFIFQILFVFFAMAINVGMMVHDKINLQNSIDLAAFYGAQKQAEVLNVIAHTNYQIRQSWKLLAWRIRAMGDSARGTHPAQGKPQPIAFSGNDTVWGLANEGATNLGVCVTTSFWAFPNTIPGENICGKGGSNISVPEIPQLSIGFFPWDFMAQNILKNLNDSFRGQCQDAGQYNWYMAIRWFGSYRMNIGIRQKLISKMAEFMRDFKDIKGQSIEAGMRATLRANLTRANLESLESNTGTFTTFNSMAGIEKENWLPNIKIAPYIPYTDIFTGNGDNCSGSVRHVTVRPRNGSSISADQYQGYVFEPVGDQDYHSTKGVEKNPWYMIYTGAKATTAPRKPFFPFGKAVNLEARSFAQPFGGRVGPWSKKVWQRQPGHQQSGDLVDPLLPPEFSGFQAGTVVDIKSIPNYSRFPNDILGLKSAPTLATSFYTKPPTETFEVKVYNHLPEQAIVDPLAKKGTKSDWQRRFEIAAVSPDLFDIQYYSIQPKFYESYLQKMEQIFTPQMPMPLDYGSDEQTKFSVQLQIDTAKVISAFKQAYFVVNNWEQVLTSWAPNGIIDYGFPADKFGKCPVIPGAVATDSNCIAGGRAGYSVKLVSKNYLESQELALAGDGRTKGPIFNPPTEF